MVAIIASPTGTALIPTHGPCLPFVEIVVSSKCVLIVFLALIIELVGFTQNLTIISWPVDIPPIIPPALLDKNFGFLFFLETHFLKKVFDSKFYFSFFHISNSSGVAGKLSRVPAWI